MREEETVGTDSLLCDLKRGNETALNKLIRMFRKKLLLQSYFILDDMDEAEDIVQEVFINFWRIKGLLSDDTSLNNYLGKAIKYESVHRLKKIRSRAEKLKEIHNIPEPSTYNNALENSELKSHLMHAIDSLPYYQKRDFIAMYLEGKSQKIIASEQNKGLQTVKNNIHEARKFLRTKLQFLIK
jgi:RNA polymerase sigma-70 factor (ECF subfamily)